MIRKAIIPAAGLGTRFLPFTKGLPKEMLPIKNKPAVHWLVEQLGACGIEEVLLVISPAKRCIIDYFAPNPAVEAILKSKSEQLYSAYTTAFSGLPNVRFAVQHEPLGLADALLQGAAFAGEEPFAVVLGDAIVQEGERHLADLLRFFAQTNSNVIGLYPVEPVRISSVGIVDVAEHDERAGARRIVKVVEKPDPRDASSNLSIIGCYVFKPDVFPLLEQSVRLLERGKEADLSFTLQALAGQGDLFGIEHDLPVFDIGTPERWFELNLRHFITDSASRDKYAAEIGRLRC